MRGLMKELDDAEPLMKDVKVLATDVQTFIVHRVCLPPSHLNRVCLPVGNEERRQKRRRQHRHRWVSTFFSQWWPW